MSLAFGSPVWLALLALAPALWWWLRPRGDDGLVIAASDGATGLKALGGRLPLDALPLLARVSCVVALVVAMAQPQLVRVFEEPVTEGVGIAFAIDLSTSMWAEDMARGTSRLEAAKATVRSFLDSREDDVGLVSFAGEALTRLPLTHDGYVVDQAVAELEVGLLTDGTDIAGAIAAGAGLLRDAPHRSKVLILVTDGAHNKAGIVPALAARAAAAVDVTIYPVAIGRVDQSSTMAADMETVLTQAARITGGQYFHAADVDALESIYEEIDRLTLPSEELVERTEIDPLGWWFVLAALLLMVGSTALRGSRWGVLP